MFTHPAIAAALADEHRRSMVASAESARLARTARDAGDDGNGKSRWPVRWFPTHRRPSTPAARKGLARLRPARAR
jgi:hypothetical protein